MRIGLFFGSFNPVHIGHLAIANYMAEYTDLDEVWLVVSPQNPFKPENALAPSHQRLSLVQRALRDSPGIKASDIELELPSPSFTINTLRVLQERYPDDRFIIVMGSDGISTFGDWKESDYIATNFQRLIYPRPGIVLNEKDLRNARLVRAPLIEISSTFIRESILKGKDVRHFVPAHLWEEIRSIYQEPNYA
ncbi:MAG: nicotinate (nicotinamide) nucleotide adenylyltransferase [Bacteroidales bacterium]